MLVKRVTLEEVERMLRTLPRGTYTTEDLLAALRQRLPTLSFYQLRRYLEELASRGVVEKIRVKVFYVDPSSRRRFAARRVLWRLG